MDVCEMVLAQLAKSGITPLLRLSETCQRLREASSSESIWETLCWHDFKLQRRSLVHGSWREMYVEHSLLHGSVKDASLRGRNQRHLSRHERAGLRSSVSQGAVEGTIWGIGNVRVSVEGTIWDTGAGTGGASTGGASTGGASTGGASTGAAAMGGAVTGGESHAIGNDRSRSAEKSEGASSDPSAPQSR